MSLKLLWNYLQFWWNGLLTFAIEKLPLATCFFRKGYRLQWTSSEKSCVLKKLSSAVWYPKSLQIAEFHEKTYSQLEDRDFKKHYNLETQNRQKHFELKNHCYTLQNLSFSVEKTRYKLLTFITIFPNPFPKTHYAAKDSVIYDKR